MEYDFALMYGQYIIMLQELEDFVKRLVFGDEYVETLEYENTTYGEIVNYLCNLRNNQGKYIYDLHLKDILRGFNADRNFWIHDCFIDYIIKEGKAKIDEMNYLTNRLEKDYEDLKAFINDDRYTLDDLSCTEVQCYLAIESFMKVIQSIFNYGCLSLALVYEDTITYGELINMNFSELINELYSLDCDQFDSSLGIHKYKDSIIRSRNYWCHFGCYKLLHDNWKNKKSLESDLIEAIDFMTLIQAFYEVLRDEED